MSEGKSDKELAFLHELYVSTDWGERFAELIDEHVKVPKKGRILYVAAGTGGHAMALGERAGDDVTLVFVDESEECLELGRAKAAAMSIEPECRRAAPDALGLRGGQFDLVVGDGSLVAPDRLPGMSAEMARVAAPGATIALTLASASSFGEFFSIYWEALQAAGVEGHDRDAETLINELPTVAEAEELAARAGFGGVTSWTRVEEFGYSSGEDFLNSPLITDFLMRSWLAPLPDDETRERVSTEVARIIDEARYDTDFVLSIKATLVVGRKAG